MKGIPAAQEVPIPLTAADWIAVRRSLGRGAFDEVAAIIMKIEAAFEQLQRAEGMSE